VTTSLKVERGKKKMTTQNYVFKNTGKVIFR
jgi:hypothetical protein